MYLSGLGGIDWGKVKAAVRGIASGALDAAKEAAARELIDRVSDTPEYQRIEREVAQERARQLAPEVLPWVLGGVVLFLVLSGRRR